MSWLDIAVVAAHLRAFKFVAKAELKKIPFFGRAAEAAGTVYIYRMLRAGILPTPAHVGSAANPKRPLAVPGNSPGTPSSNPAE